MPLAKQIGTIARTNLTNSAHMAMNTEIHDRILAVTVAVLHLETLEPGYKQYLDREGESVNRVTKSATTEQLEAKDAERDKTFQFITSMNGSYLVCPDPQMQAAAKVLDAALKAYKNLYSKAYSEETALIDGLLRDMDDPERKKAATTLHLDTYFTQLKTQNDEYKTLDASRTDEYTARVKTDTSKARKATDETLDLIVQRVNAYAVLEPTDGINNFIDTVNQIYRKYKDLIAAKGGPSTPTHPDDKPYPTPDPSPEEPDTPVTPGDPVGDDDRPVIE